MDSAMDMQRKLEILADANPARGIPEVGAAVHRSDPSPHLLEGARRRSPPIDQVD
jgi:hypothetical protein